MVIQIPTAKLARTIISKVLLFIVIRIIFIFTKDRKYAKSGKEVLFFIYVTDCNYCKYYFNGQTGILCAPKRKAIKF